MLGLVSAISGLFTESLVARKRRLTVSFALVGPAFFLVTLAIVFGLIAAFIWLSQMYGAILAACMLSGGFVSLSLVLLMTHAIVQRRLKRKAARAAALKKATLVASLATVRSKGWLAGGAVAVLALTLASQLYSQDD